MGIEPQDNNQPVQPPVKKSRLDKGFDDWGCDGPADEDEDSASASVARVLEDELDRYLREATPTTSENLLQWWKTEV